MDADRLALLKSLRLLDKIPERQLAALSGFLKPLSFEDGGLVFDEGGKGNSLFFITSGGVSISKRASAEAFKDLAILGPGDCFGEMVLFGETVRSARASAHGATVVLELGRDDLDRWLKSNPELALEFFSQLAQVQSKRLRRTSKELIMLFDLSHLLLEPCGSGKELLEKVLSRLVPHLEGSWSAAAYLYNAFNDEMDLVARQGAQDLSALGSRLPLPEKPSSLWIGPDVYFVSLPGEKRPLGYLLFHAPAALANEDRAELARTLAAAARLLTAALENIEFRTEAALRTRLKSQAHGTPL